jgi:uncharacterized delta-60 repeat protein
MKRVMFLTILLGLFFVSNAVAVEPGDTLWTRTYGGSDNDYGYSVQQTSDGGYIIAGTTKSFGAGNYDFYLLKTDASGGTVWTRTFGGSNLDYGYSAVQTTDGGYAVAGRTKSFGAGDYDVYLVKTDADGNTTWTRTYGGSDTDEGQSVQQTTDGGYIIAGYNDPWGTAIMDVYLVKTDAQGGLLWARSYGPEDDYECGYSVQQTADGGYIVAGSTASAETNDTDLYLVKTDANGDCLWARTYGGDQWDEGYSVEQTADGNYIVAGYTESFGAGSMDFYLLKIDADGDTLWTRTYGGSGRDEGRSVHQTTDGGYIVAGYSWSFGAGQSDFYLVRTDADGDTLWTHTYGGTRWDYGRSVQQTADGGYILTGYTDSFGAGGTDLYLVKTVGEAQEPEVSIEIIPDDPPVTVPQGGRFGYTGTLTNNTEDPQATDIWVMAVGPLEGVYGPFKEFYDFHLNPGEGRSAHFNQRVANLAPLGHYDYIAYCGDYPSVVMDSSFFQIEVIAATSSGREDSGWLLSGSFDGREGLTNLPSGYALIGSHPNPFNASTVIEYELPQASEVTLEVYNLLGEKVTTLVDKRQQAGYRAVIWDASENSSGIYFYRLTAGDISETKRMILVK